MTKHFTSWAFALGACQAGSDRSEVAEGSDLVRLSAEDYCDKVHASRLGQMIGNMFGLAGAGSRRGSAPAALWAALGEELTAEKSPRGDRP